MDFLCLHVLKWQERRVEAKHGGGLPSSTRSDDIVLLRNKGCYYTPTVSPGRPCTKAWRALLILFFCAGGTVAASEEEQTSRASAQMLSSLLEHKEAEKTDALSEKVDDHTSPSNGQKAALLGADAPAIDSTMQTSSRTDATKSWKLRGSVQTSSESRARKARKPRKTPHHQSARILTSLPADQLLTLAAVEEALIALEDNPNDVTQALSDVRPCCMKRVFEESFLPHAEAAVQRLGLKIDIWSSAKGLIPRQQPVDTRINEGGEPGHEAKSEVRCQITSQDVVASLLPRIRRQHWLYDIDEAQASPEALARYAALKAALENTNYVKDLTHASVDDPTDSAEEAKAPAVDAESGTGEDTSVERSDLLKTLTPTATAVLIALVASGVLTHAPRANVDNADSTDKRSQQR